MTRYAETHRNVRDTMNKQSKSSNKTPRKNSVRERTWIDFFGDDYEYQICPMCRDNEIHFSSSNWQAVLAEIDSEIRRPICIDCAHHRPKKPLNECVWDPQTRESLGLPDRQSQLKHQIDVVERELRSLKREVKRREAELKELKAMS